MARTRAAATATDNAEGAETTVESNGEGRKLKLVGADTYHCHKVKDDVIQRGELITVTDDAVADALLDDMYRDGLNNEHPYFRETSDAEEAAEAKRAARRNSAKAVEADEAE